MAPAPVSSSSSDNGQTIPVLSKGSVSSLLFFLSPHPSLGNTGFRYFPCSGYLGLTPIRAEGGSSILLCLSNSFRSFSPQLSAQSSRTTKNPSSQNLLPSPFVVTNAGHVWRVATQMFSSTTPRFCGQNQRALTMNQSGISSFLSKFRCPPMLLASATQLLSIIDVYGELKPVSLWPSLTFWYTEIASVLTHTPISGVGSRQVRHSDLSLVRYDIPSWLPPPVFPEPMLNLQTNKPRAPRIQYSIHPPQSAIGPMDLVSIPLHLQPIDKDVSIRSASVVVERRIVLNDNPTPPDPSLWTRPDGLYTKSSNSSLHKPPSSPNLSPLFPNRSSSSTSLSSLYPDTDPTLSLHSSGSTITPDTPSFPSTSTGPSSTKAIVNPVADAQSSGSFTRDQRGIFSKTLTLQWPSAKSRAHWAIGETITSDLVSVKFILRTKVSYSCLVLNMDVHICLRSSSLLPPVQTRSSLPIKSCMLFLPMIRNDSLLLQSMVSSSRPCQLGVQPGQNPSLPGDQKQSRQRTTIVSLKPPVFRKVPPSKMGVWAGNHGHKWLPWLRHPRRVGNTIEGHIRVQARVIGQWISQALHMKLALPEQDRDLHRVLQHTQNDTRRRSYGIR